MYISQMKLIGQMRMWTQIVFCPVVETITSICNGSYYYRLSIETAIVAFNCAAFRWIGSKGDREGLLLEMRHIGRRFSDRKRIARISAYLLVILGPINEVVTSGCAGSQGAVLTVIVGAAACDSAAIGGIGCGSDGELLQREIGHQSSVARDGECVVGIGGDGSAVLGPIHEGVASGRSGAHGTLLSLLVGATACDGSSIGRVGRHANGVVLLLDLEVGHQVAVAINGEVISR